MRSPRSSQLSGRIMQSNFINRLRQQWQELVTRGVDGSSLAVSRILLGVIAINDCWWVWPKLGSLGSHEFRFPYGGFEWVPSSADAIKVLGPLFALSAAGVMLGLLYRAASVLLLLSYTWLLLLD